MTTETIPHAEKHHHPTTPRDAKDRQGLVLLLFETESVFSSLVLSLARCDGVRLGQRFRSSSSERKEFLTFDERGHNSLCFFLFLNFVLPFVSQKKEGKKEGKKEKKMRF